MNIPPLFGKGQTRVVCLKRRGGRVLQGCDVYIGRACTMGGWNLQDSKWANPFTVKQCGSVREAVRKYEAYISTNHALLAQLHELQGKTLGCWCKKRPADPCHGDVLVKLLKEQNTE